MLSHHPDHLAITARQVAAVLGGAASARTLSLLNTVKPEGGHSALALAGNDLANAEAHHRDALAVYRGACARLGEANATRTTPLRVGSPTFPISREARRAARRDAMRLINSRRALLRRAVARVEAARAALAALAH